MTEITENYIQEYKMLQSGTIFKLDGNFYIKSDHAEQALNLQTGRLYCISCDAQVQTFSKVEIRCN